MSKISCAEIFSPPRENGRRVYVARSSVGQHRRPRPCPKYRTVDWIGPNRPVSRARATNILFCLQKIITKTNKQTTLVPTID